jgi:hypothetical protein
VEPGEPLPPIVPEEVKKLSPLFWEIYKEAYCAEKFGLIKVAGPGYRKALEFLVKDYVLANKEKFRVEDDGVKKAQLGQVIENYLPDSRTKQLAKRAIWLGNDETHYVRQWIDKDLADLKVLTSLVINSVQNEIVADQYLSEM